MNTVDELINTMDEYIDFIGQELGVLCVAASGHHYKCRPEVYERGVISRERIRQLKSELGIKVKHEIQKEASSY